MSDITERVQRIIEEKLGVDASEVKPEATFTNDLGADSLDTVELIMELEKRIQHHYSGRSSRENCYCR